MRENTVPENFTAFPEEERVRGGTMREEIMTMVIEALNGQGHPDLSLETIRADAAHRALAVELLRDWRPITGRFVAP